MNTNTIALEKETTFLSFGAAARLAHETEKEIKKTPLWDSYEANLLELVLESSVGKAILGTTANFNQEVEYIKAKQLSTPIDYVKTRLCALSMAFSENGNDARFFALSDAAANFQKPSLRKRITNYLLTPIDNAICNLFHDGKDQHYGPMNSAARKAYRRSKKNKKFARENKIG